MIKQSLTALGLVTVVLMLFSVESAMAQDSEPDWSFSANIGWAWREIDGTLFDYVPPLTGAATTDSLGLGTSSEPQASFGVRWKQLMVNFVYLPSKFTGDGFLVEALDFGDGPVIGNADPIASDIEVEMYLANIEYDLLKRGDMDLGVGFGLGTVNMDIVMTPESVTGVSIIGNVPFGYLTSTFVKRWDKFAATFGLQGLSVAIDDYSITYKSVNIAAAYELMERGRFNLSVAGGYRYVDFDYSFDDDTSGAKTSTAFELTGPYIGLQGAW
jgi:hypothetical protein